MKEGLPKAEQLNQSVYSPVESGIVHEMTADGVASQAKHVISELNAKMRNDSFTEADVAEAKITEDMLLMFLESGDEVSENVRTTFGMLGSTIDAANRQISRRRKYQQ